jgi:ferritin-like metal-binding protein YciE
MGFFSQDIKNMDDLFVHTLRDIYYAEKQIVQALPEMIEKSTDAQLKQGFQSHLRETENHVKRLEKVFQLQGKEAKGVDCPAIDGINRGSRGHRRRSGEQAGARCRPHCGGTSGRAL